MSAWMIAHRPRAETGIFRETWWSGACWDFYERGKVYQDKNDADAAAVSLALQAESGSDLIEVRVVWP